MSEEIYSKPWACVSTFDGSPMQYVHHFGVPSSRIVNINSEFRVGVRMEFSQAAGIRIRIDPRGDKIVHPWANIQHTALFINMSGYVDYEWSDYVKQLEELNLFDFIVITSTRSAMGQPRVNGLAKMLGFRVIDSAKCDLMDGGSSTILAKPGIRVHGTARRDGVDFEVYPPRVDRVNEN